MTVYRKKNHNFVSQIKRLVEENQDEKIIRTWHQLLHIFLLHIHKSSPLGLSGSCTMYLSYTLYSCLISIQSMPRLAADSEVPKTKWQPPYLADVTTTKNLLRGVSQRGSEAGGHLKHLG
jgi:hypothetical protein